MNLIHTLQSVKKLVDIIPKEVVIRSRLPITQTEYDQIIDIFSGSSITQKIDPSVLEGVVIQIGDLVIDTTVSAQLIKLSQNLTDTTAGVTPQEIRSRILGFDASTTPSNTGSVLSIQDGVCTISGLSEAQYFEMVYIGDLRIPALILNVSTSTLGAVVLGEYNSVKPGDSVLSSGELASIGVSDNILGRVVNSTGDAIDDKQPLINSTKRLIEKQAPGVMTRTPVVVPLQTGITAIDALIPIGRGQRELIMGDRQTGKTAIAIDAILNQKTTGVICIYVAVGQKQSKVARVVEQLKIAGALEYTTVVSASASESAGMQFLAPYSGVAIAEFFAEQGKDVLIVYDDLSKHAIAYRELSLLLKRPPGREAYPGDVFYLHSRLLERACNLNAENGGGSITALPIVETLAGDISAYIPTNVISITDGQLFLESELFYKGQRPAINVGLSVSRVGGAAQTKAIKKVSGSLKLQLAQFRELESFSQFASDLDEATKQQLNRGKVLLEILKQNNNQPRVLSYQVISLFLANSGLFDTLPTAEIASKITTIYSTISATEPELIASLEMGNWSDEIVAELTKNLSLINQL